jgi:hypothetical protein
MRNDFAKPLFRQMLKRIWEGAHLTFPITAAILAVYHTRLIIGPLLNQSGDDSHHLLSEYAISHAIRAGDNPLGPLGLDFGQPLLRFYQCLFYLYNVGIHLITDIDLVTVHNTTIVVCFALSPFAYLYCLRKLGLNRWAAAFASFASMISVAAFGHSFEAYHQTGIVTQAMGGLFFPWFMGSFAGMLRGENRPTTTALLFALAFLSHAIMAVFAAFAGALYFCIAHVDLRKNVLRLGAFTVIGVALVAFWVFPFIAHTMELRPVPDSIIRGSIRTLWFNSVSTDELATVLTSGRLLDDPQVLHDNQTDPDDKLMDLISIIGTLKTRPPIVTFFTGLGALLALMAVRQSSLRFLLGGLAFALMLFAGPDDFRWMSHLPFIKQIQSFRCTYLVEFFAFALVGYGIDRILRFIWSLSRFKHVLIAIVLRCIVISIVVTGTIWCSAEILALGATHLAIRDQTRIDQATDALHTLSNKGHPFRVAATYQGHKLFQDWFVRSGYQTYGTHWVAVGPSAGFHLAWGLGSADSNPDFYSLVGIRYFAGDYKTTPGLAKKLDKDGAPRFERLPNGPAVHGPPIRETFLFDSGMDHFLRPVAGIPIVVVCNHAQWIWLTKTWTHQYRAVIHKSDTPFPMRVNAGQLDAGRLLDAVPALLYLDHEEIKEDHAALRDYIGHGGVVLSPSPISGLKVTLIEREEQLWLSLPPGVAKKAIRPGHAPREIRNTLFDNATINRPVDPRRSLQHFAFEVSLHNPQLVVLPMTAVPGWKAKLDGAPLNIFPTGPNMIGAYLPAGAHHLVFYWEMPLWHRIALALTFLGLAIVLFSWIPLGRRL